MYIPGNGQKRQFEREHNKETLQLAETIRAKRLLDIQATCHGLVSKVRSEIGFLAFFKKMVEKKLDSSRRPRNLAKHLPAPERFYEEEGYSHGKS